MNPFANPSSGQSSDWLMFLVMVIAIGLGVSIVAVWVLIIRPKDKKKRRKHHRHHRQHNRTLAESGGLPPMRDPNQPPPGP